MSSTCCPTSTPTSTPRRCAANSRPRGRTMTPSLKIGLAVAAMLAFAAIAGAQTTPPGPAEDVEQVTGEAQRTPEAPVSTIDRPIYRAIQESKRELSEKYGITWALE